MRTVALLLLLASSPALAQDTSATMAALQGEKAGCRYLMTLCDEVVRLSGPGALSRKGGPDLASRKLLGLLQATDVLAAKYDKPPACIAECNARLGAVSR